MFDYDEAFSRNRGWVTTAEQKMLRKKRIAIAGLGGVGGAHLTTLARLGIERFSIADPDAFELVNFNRQVGATVDTLGRSKVEVMEEQARAINPEMQLRSFSDGIGAENIDDFLEDADLYVDSLDIFALEARRLVFRRCAERGIPAITAAPLGMSTALMVFMPNRMTFEEYFRLEGCSRAEQLLRFLIGVAPASLQRGYFLDPSALDFDKERAPSTPMAIQLAAGVAATAALKILLNRGKLLVAPWGMQFDPYTHRMRTTWRPGGNNNPLQRFTLYMASRFLR